jgi:hypothetical protein
MAERKVVRRSIAVALGIICIILITSLGGAVALYMGARAVLRSYYSPSLIGVLNTEDERYSFAPPSLHIYGYVANVGADTASNVLLYVEGFQDEILAFNTTVSLGAVYGRSFSNYVDSRIAYVGGNLTKWHIWSSPAGIDNWWTANSS